MPKLELFFLEYLFSEIWWFDVKFEVPQLLPSYREASAEVIEVLTQFSKCVERASIDEAYIDLTEEVDKRMASLEARQIDAQMLANTHVIGYEPEEPPDGDDKGSNAGTYSAFHLCSVQCLLFIVE